MRIAIASGKGGAGKTTVAASLAFVWDAPCVVADADVEAPNMHLFLAPVLNAGEPVHLEVPVLDKECCTACGACRDICRFKAIAKFGSGMAVFPDMCHGCGGCFAVCPENALSPGQRLLGELSAGTILNSRHAFLMGKARIGEAMTPPQLRALQKKLDALLAQKDAEGRAKYSAALIDAPPGVSCPAMTVARESDAILLVAEPTPFGFYDFRLAHEAFVPLAKPMAVAINRSGMPGNEQGDAELAAYCAANNLPVLAALPFEREVAEHYAQGRVIASISPVWQNRFTALRDALRAFAAKEAAHA